MPKKKAKVPVVDLSRQAKITEEKQERKKKKKSGGSGAKRSVDLAVFAAGVVQVLSLAAGTIALWYDETECITIVRRTIECVNMLVSWLLATFAFMKLGNPAEMTGEYNRIISRTLGSATVSLAVMAWAYCLLK